MMGSEGRENRGKSTSNQGNKINYGKKSEYYILKLEILRISP
jgi:hypothetical protein